MYYATLHIGSYCRVCADVYTRYILPLSLSLPVFKSFNFRKQFVETQRAYFIKFAKFK